MTTKPALTFAELRAANIARQAEWCPDQLPDLSFRGNELAGEVGEACNVIKKLERARHGWRGSRDTVEHMAEELADVVICADLCAITANVDLGAAIARKFNETSEANGLSVRLADGPGPAPPFVFARYVNGVPMAEGVTIERQVTLDGAMAEVARIASRGPNGEGPVLVYAPEPATPQEGAEPRGCPTPGACSCPPTPAPEARLERTKKIARTPEELALVLADPAPPTEAELSELHDILTEYGLPNDYLSDRQEEVLIAAVEAALETLWEAPAASDELVGWLRAFVASFERCFGRGREHDTLSEAADAIATLQKQLAAKDARIAELEGAPR